MKGPRPSATFLHAVFVLLLLAAGAVLAASACSGSDTTTSTKGAAAWSQQNSGVNGILRDVAFPDAKHGWAVGYQGGPAGPSIILATGDGGATWSQQESGSKAQPCAVTFPDAEHHPRHRGRRRHLEPAGIGEQGAALRRDLPRRQARLGGGGLQR
jgi:hypothetical protein